MIVDVYNKENKKTGTLNLPEAIFGRKWNPDLVHQAFLAQTANRRGRLAHAKGRGEVRGGGRKPWAQKGTGRARHGSIRSPIWAHGGVTHGPTKERKFEKKINKKMKRAALASLLSKKAALNEIKVIEDLKINSPKTKNLASVLNKFIKERKSLLLIPQKENRNLFLAGRNLPKTKVLAPNSLNVYDCLAHKYLYFEKEAVEDFVKNFKS